MLVKHLGVKADLFFGSEGVEHAPDRIHLAGDMLSGAPLRSLENHVLQKVRHAVFGLHFPPGAIANPDAHRDRTDVLHGLGNNYQAVGEYLAMNIPYVRDHILFLHSATYVA